MKIFTLAVIMAAVSTGCTKNDVLPDINSEMNARASVTGLASSNSTLITRWESGYDWATSDSSGFKIFSHVRSTPELTSEVMSTGALLIWLKDVPYDGRTLVEEPRLIPFGVIPYFGDTRPAYEQVWYSMEVPGKITVKYRTNRHQFVEGPIIAPDRRVDAQYFILSAGDLNRIGHTRESIRRVTYGELLELLDMA